MPTLSYLHLDVFTRTAFGGNQLAVFLDPPADLPAAVMQRIANEMAFSESTFVFPPERPDTDVRVRIFTPADELPMAGHPTIGTAFAMAHAGQLSPSQQATTFGEGVGPVRIELTWKNRGLDFAWMTQSDPTFGPILRDPAPVAAALGLEARDLCPGGLPVQRVSCGVPYVIVPVASRAAVDRAVLDARGLRRAFEADGWPDLALYLMTLDRGTDEAAAYTRMFAPGIGIVEDPATGSAAGPLGAYLVQHGRWPVDARSIVALQGVRMGRPSWLHIAPAPEWAAMEAVRVGGEAAVVGDGKLRL
jgi:trans-2,3-dihydro-3-hydroxyanthranilate isomerase